MTDSLLDIINEAGFDLVQTGGGCTALEKVYEDGSYTMITAREDAMAPTSLEDAVDTGHYRTWGDFDDIVEYDTLAEALEVLS